jgi:hypothetical protein
MLTVEDESHVRSDLAQRRETKFVLAGNQLALLRDVLTGTMRRQIHGNAVSTVRSIYFDDARLSACHANIDGLGQRRKLRLRWYDRPLPDREGYLEIKWRNGRLTGKHRLRLGSAGALSQLSYSELRTALLAAVPAKYVGFVMACSDPVVIVEYHREHFISPDRDLRVTLDYDLKFYDQTGKARMSAAFGRPLPDFVVLEGKTPVGRERELRQLLAPVTLRATRCSKYVHGCRLLDLIRGGE